MTMPVPDEGSMYTMPRDGMVCTAGCSGRIASLSDASTSTTWSYRAARSLASIMLFCRSETCVSSAATHVRAAIDTTIEAAATNHAGDRRALLGHNLRSNG